MTRRIVKIEKGIAHWLKSHLQSGTRHAGGLRRPHEVVMLPGKEYIVGV